MCTGGSPEPDINKPAYTPSDIDKNMTMTKTEDGKTSEVKAQEKALFGDGPVSTQGSGIKSSISMRQPGR